MEGTAVEIGGSQWELMSPLYVLSRRGGLVFRVRDLRYQSTDIDISDVTFLKEDHLQSLEIALFLSKDYSDSLKGIALFVPGMSGDFETIGGDAMNYMAMAGVRWKKSETFQWIFGAFYSTGFDDDMFLPAVGFMWEPSDKADLVFAGPIIRYRYSLSESFDWIAGGQFSGNQLAQRRRITHDWRRTLIEKEFAMQRLPPVHHRSMEPDRRNTECLRPSGLSLGREVAIKKRQVLVLALDTRL